MQTVAHTKKPKLEVYNIKKDKDLKYSNLRPVLKNRSNSKSQQQKMGQGAMMKHIRRNSDLASVDQSPNSIVIGEYLYSSNQRTDDSLTKPRVLDS